ncbi:hypothetical protein OAU29_01850 [Porticoccaceae bacterium]|nr:hypothetical protein [Porticoccaceae bacterium]|tara:strand:+ start:1487 stop:2065 length:579 start_codon:yes stop_codon:yes gene_type:complete
MAITNGINIACDDLQASGGIRNILIRTWATGDAITYVNSATSHSISSITNGGSAATWFNYEFKNELPSLTVTAAKENGSTSYECALSFMMPEMDDSKAAALQSLMDTCMMVIAVGNNGKNYVLGVSQKYSNEKATLRNQTYASMTGAEGASGAAYNDDNGWTVTMGCKQWEAPRLYTGTINLFTATSTSTTS